MKYNLSDIMSRAWKIKKSYKARRLTFGDCLRKAWDEAKAAAAESAYFGAKFESGMEITMLGITCVLNRWTKHGHDRVYINRNGRSDGYIDLRTGEVYLSNKYLYLSRIADAILSMEF